MFKNFAAALVPMVVLGRGTNDGTSAENATEIELIPNKLKLFTYNQNIAGIDVFRGDLSYKTDSSDGQYSEFVEYGFCFRPSAEGSALPSSNWDCMQARTQVNMSKIATLFTVQDKRFSGTPASGSSPFVSIPDKDSKITEDASKNW